MSPLSIRHLPPLPLPLLLSFVLCAAGGAHDAARRSHRPAGFLLHRRRRRSPAFVLPGGGAIIRRRSSAAAGAAGGEDDGARPGDGGSSSSPYVGPILPPESELVAGVSLGELSLDLALAPSTVSPAGLGLYARLSDPDGVSSVTVPALALLGGYSREGTFESSDVGDKTVGFALRDADTGVFYERGLVSVGDAVRSAAETEGDGMCGLIGHELRLIEGGEEGEDEDGAPTTAIEVEPVDDGFPRYFVPELVNRGTAATDEDYTVQNFGQFCNDLAWNYDDPPSEAEEYAVRSDEMNVVQLVWRMEYDPEGRCLRPSWPVSVFGRDVTFDNAEFMEIGTRYGWAYWQATVDLDKI
mmetsp:Transcript_57368/g.171121  ORF Transcript_57368/g.171121 Transcript_57368/m.171121 type:complete len:355 (-) Transcript_57368:222-1286(-)